MSKKIIRLNESDLHRLIKESVNKVLMEFSPDSMGQNQTVDELADEIRPSYQQYMKIARQFGDYEDVGDQENMKKLIWQAEEILNKIADKINTFLVDGDVYVEFYHEDPFSFVWLESTYYDEFLEDFLESLRSGRPYSEFAKNRRELRDLEKSNRRDEFNKEQKRQMEFWKERGMSPHLEDFENTDWKYSDEPNDTQLTYKQGNYGVKTSLPNVKGKIDLPKESPKTRARMAALNKK